MIAQIYRSLLTVSLISLFSFTLVLGLDVDHAWAKNPLTQLVNSFNAPIATVEKVKATTRGLEGKVQEEIGNITGDRKDRLAGVAKQVEASVRNNVENVKESVKLPERIQSINKNIEGKAQETMGNITGDRQDRVAGKAKQVESKTRNLIEDAKDKVKEIFQ
ncbi:MAG: CsbD family protein [Pseudanabaena frigida]|uniref:CsbD family protein n=1 Tax=Pseudanabaena frigida TaxID=945775 RepID=A0A2W4W453_9CYAN|nr:MAG: CsbD family protein [Pseudanabaena frigida]